MMLVVAEAVLVFELLILFMLLMVVLKFNSLDELFILAEKKRAKQKEKEREKNRDFDYDVPRNICKEFI